MTLPTEFTQTDYQDRVLCIWRLARDYAKSRYTHPDEIASEVAKVYLSLGSPTQFPLEKEIIRIAKKTLYYENPVPQEMQEESIRTSGIQSASLSAYEAGIEAGKRIFAGKLRDVMRALSPVSRFRREISRVLLHVEKELGVVIREKKISPCRWPKCSLPSKSKGLCPKHYQREKYQAYKFPRPPRGPG